MRPTSTLVVLPAPCYFSPVFQIPSFPDEYQSQVDASGTYTPLAFFQDLVWYPHITSKVVSTTIAQKKKTFIRELVTLCDRAQKRSHRESDLYPLWDTVWNAFANRADHNQAEPEITVSVASQFTLERPFLNARGKTSYRYKIPDTVVLKFDDTRQTKVVFWVEAKRLPWVAWFSVIGRITAKGIITETIAQQVNAQAQYTWSYFKLSRNATVYAFVICGPYFTLLRYTGDNLSPDFFGVAHARKGAWSHACKLL